MMRARKRVIRKAGDPAQRREEARRFASKVSRVILVIAALVGIVVIANRWSATERLERVVISGLRVLDSAEVMERASLKIGEGLRSMDLKAVEDRLASHPFLSRVSVHRGAAGVLQVTVVERRPVALVVLDGTPMYLDSQATALPFRFSRATFDVPLVSGVERIDSSVRPAVTVIDSARAMEALDVVHTLRVFDESLYRQISEIRRTPDGEYRLLTTDGAVQVLAGRPAEIPGRLPKLDVFMRTAMPARAGGRPRYIDLRWRGQVIARWS